MSLESAFRQLLLDLGQDPEATHLKETPEKAANALRFLTQGYQQNLDFILEKGLLEAPNQQMILLKNIDFTSICAHHLLPFTGYCHIAYIPNRYILGVKRFKKIIHFFSRRLQLQEYLTTQIAECIEHFLQPLGSIVLLEAKHFCSLEEGVMQLTTAKASGQFQNNKNLYSDFMNVLKLSGSVN